MSPRQKFDPLPTLLARGDLIRPDELARALKISQAAVYLWCERQIIPFLRMGKSIRFLPEDIKEFLRAKRQAAIKSPGGGPVQAGT
jgi:excisionase family DNA binding protein